MDGGAECWKVIFEAAAVQPGDRIYFAFSFGPFIAFGPAGRKRGSLAPWPFPVEVSLLRQRLKTNNDYGATYSSARNVPLHMASRGAKSGMTRQRVPP